MPPACSLIFSSTSAVSTSFAITPALNPDPVGVVAICFAFTVTEHVADLPPAEAVMVALPTALMVTVPLASTVATFASDEDHAIVPSGQPWPSTG